MKISAMLVMALMLGACSGGDAPATAAPGKGTVSEDNVFKAEVDALARAKESEKVILDAAEQQRKDIEANE